MTHQPNNPNMEAARLLYEQIEDLKARVTALRGYL